ncbi:hypothetical protein EHH44_06865 [Mycolicibacter terrae]|uniref:Uncharacterized protein n=2 Tax=Mycolicibacter TaxID=1073531 RepID=A0A1A2XXG4_MYCSD|nr:MULTISPECIES: hypothetical protein [Mycolicibacter]OBH18007.1 hypothetical protein A5694_02470 [Mycolicibacter sinensis]OBI29571.1 hypothetical protein A5710_21575 [Mycolicibacter sinensis]RRR46881.1 hypothetical protein EHH44_06865 [Mycolicibacter terrae]
MPGLADRLATVLATVLTTDAEPDGAVTVHHEATLASLRVVPITDELELVSLTQILGWDLALTKKLRERAAEQARLSQLGTVTLVEKGATKTADVLLRYNFPGSGLTDDALCTLVLLVLAKGVDIREALTA